MDFSCVTVIETFIALQVIIPTFVHLSATHILVVILNVLAVVTTDIRRKLTGVMAETLSIITKMFILVQIESQ